MVKVHLVRLERTAAVRTRNASQLAQELEGRGLPNAHALDLLRAVARVVRDVERALAAACCHAAIKNTYGRGVNRTLRVALSQFSELAP